MSDPFTPQDDSWPLGLAPLLGNPLPRRMQALTIHRDQYGPPSRFVRLEIVAAPRLKPNESNRVLVAILATGPNFNTNFAAPPRSSRSRSQVSRSPRPRAPRRTRARTA